ncbi:hypothetical protein ZIOFF_031078 [Zingiber officinale]|uniref:Uncharacterized protein n=1 Tax=Zingiber officinale TaxID=94328 RepID=A0A8J5LC81_ZINOF|nr:hypothetical protein ZIOFF_031078 [Zingiber officinale]
MWPPPSAFELAGAPGYSRSSPRRRREIIDYVFSSGRIQASAVPFSWERRPGISKTAAAAGGFGHLLPLPPAPAASHRKRSATSHRNRSATSAGDEDPFAVALAECAKRPPGPSIEELFTPRRAATATRQRPVSSSARSISDRLGLHAVSCKARCAVADSVVFLPRSPGPQGSASFPYALSSAWSISDRLDLIAGWCKATCPVADSAVYVPRRPGREEAPRCRTICRTAGSAKPDRPNKWQKKQPAQQ